MFPFNKKPNPVTTEAPKPEPAHNEVRERLRQTDTRLGEALKEFKRRMEDRERRACLP